MEKGNGKLHLTAVVLFMLYLVILFYLLFFSETYGRTMDSGYRYNLVLFKEIKRFWFYRAALGWKMVLLNLAGNIVAFAPFGFFLPQFCRAAKNAVLCVLFSALFSLAVETVQLFSRVGAFDVDDILLNTVGGLAGYCCYRIACLITQRRKQQQKRKEE